MAVRTLSDKDLYIKDSTTVRSVVRRRILYDKLIPYTCAICSSEPLWKDLPMSLILDHINGINNDHRLENLRFLCPNCNHQQPTYAGRNKKRKEDNLCIDCKTKIHKNSERCNHCSTIKKHKEGKMRYSKQIQMS